MELDTEKIHTWPISMIFHVAPYLVESVNEGNRRGSSAVAARLLASEGQTRSTGATCGRILCSWLDQRAACCVCSSWAKKSSGPHMSSHVAAVEVGEANQTTFSILGRYSTRTIRVVFIYLLNESPARGKRGGGSGRIVHLSGGWRWMTMMRMTRVDRAPFVEFLRQRGVDAALRQSWCS